MAKEVFISYSSVNADEANAVCAALEAAGHSCWIAPRDIAPGADWSEAIMSGLHGCRVFILVLTEQSNVSPQVKREVERAVHRDVTFIAFRMENVALTPAMEYFISTSHWLDATARPLELPLQRLCLTVEQALKAPDNRTLLAASAGDAPPVRPPSRVTGNLPTHATAFVGRQREVQQVQERLDEGARLITLTGLGGIGKTRIALKVAVERQQQYAGGAWFVDLAAINEPDRMLPAIATTLGIREEADRLPLEQIAQHLRQTDTLLVLDNFEHILTASEYLDDLLNACPRLTILATSRAALNISTEYEVSVAELTPQEATALFTLRAQQIKAGFTLDEKSRKNVEAICRHLDGIPLAIELAATQIRMLNVAQLEKQLSQRFRMLVSPYKDVAQRQRTLKAALDWSYDLLTREYQELFARLSVFQGGFTLEDAEAVCDQEDVYFGLAALREQSLLRVEESEELPRFSMLDTLREYGRDRLQASGGLEAASERHARYFAELARREGMRLRESGGNDAFALLSAQSDNLRAALDWFWKVNQTESAAEMTVNLRWFWERGGWLREGHDSLEQAVKHADRLADATLLARIFQASGWFAFLRGDYAEAETHTQRSLKYSEEADAPDIQAIALHNLALIAQAQQRFDQAETLFEQSAMIDRKSGNDAGLADLLMNLGLLHSSLGNYDRAQQHFSEAQSLFEKRRDVKGVAGVLCNQSDMALRQTKWKEAEIFAEQSLQRFRQLNDRVSMAYALTNLAEAAARQDKHPLVESAVREAYTICAAANLLFLLPILLVTQARSQIAQHLTGSAAASLASARRLRTLLDIPCAPEEQHEIEYLERRVRLEDTGDLFGSVLANLAAASVEDILDRLAPAS